MSGYVPGLQQTLIFLMEEAIHKIPTMCAHMAPLQVWGSTEVSVFRHKYGDHAPGHIPREVTTSVQEGGGLSS